MAAPVHLELLDAPDGRDPQGQSEHPDQLDFLVNLPFLDHQDRQDLWDHSDLPDAPVLRDAPDLTAPQDLLGPQVLPDHPDHLQPLLVAVRRAEREQSDNQNLLKQQIKFKLRINETHFSVLEKSVVKQNANKRCLHYKKSFVLWSRCDTTITTLLNLSNRIDHIEAPLPRGVLPIIAYTGRLRPKEQGGDFTS